MAHKLLHMIFDIEHFSAILKGKRKNHIQLDLWLAGFNVLDCKMEYFKGYFLLKICFGPKAAHSRFL